MSDLVTSESILSHGSCCEFFYHRINTQLLKTKESYKNPTFLSYFIITCMNLCLWLIQNPIIHIIYRLGESLLHRFTNIGFNWKTHTVRSLLEIICWSRGIYASMKIYQDVTIGIELGTAIVLIMSICDELVLALVHKLFHMIQKNPQYLAIIGKMGFDISQNTSDPIHEITLYSALKTILLAYLGVALINLSFMTITNRYNFFGYSMLSILTGVITVFAAEFFYYWIPRNKYSLQQMERNDLFQSITNYLKQFDHIIVERGKESILNFGD